MAALLIVCFAALAAMPLAVNPGLLFVAGLTLIQALFALSWNLLFGYTGLASFGHAGFFAIGAYSTGAALRYGLPLPFLAVLALAALLGGLVAFLVGLFALRRLAGIFLAVLTVALTEVLGRIISYTPALGAQDGLSDIPRPKIDLPFVTIDLGSGAAYFWFLLVVCSALTVALWWLTHSRVGRVFQAIRQDSERAAFIGIDVARYRLISFVISGAVAAVAGGLFAPWTRIVTLDEVNWLASTQPILNTLLGGVGSFWGPVVGATAFALINYGTRTFAGLSEMLVGGILVVVVVAAPGGLIGLFHLLLRRLAPRHP